MATKLHGLLNLTKIGNLIKANRGRVYKNSKGEECIWIDVVERRNGADQYGNTHSIQFYDKDSGTTYLADLKPQEFGSSSAPAPAPASQPVEDLPSGEPDDFPF